jgi:hypothetical protein
VLAPLRARHLSFELISELISEIISEFLSESLFDIERARNWDGFALLPFIAASRWMRCALPIGSSASQDSCPRGPAKKSRIGGHTRARPGGNAHRSSPPTNRLAPRRDAIVTRVDRALTRGAAGIREVADRARRRR